MTWLIFSNRATAASNNVTLLYTKC